MKKVALVVGLYKATKYLDDLLPSLLAINYSREDLKIIIIDDCSPDNTVAVFRDWLAAQKTEDQNIFELIIRKQNGGFVRNYNEGMQRALDLGYDYIYILNQDTTVEPNFLQEIVAVAEANPSAPIIQSKLLYFRDHNLVNSIGNELHYLGFGYCRGNLAPDRSLPTMAVPTGSGAGLMFRRDFLLKSGLMAPELFMYAEDIYISLLARIQGFDVLIAPSSIVYHKYDFVSSTAMLGYLERNRFLTMLWFYKWPTLLLILPAFLFMELGQIYFSFVRGWWKKRLWAYGQILNPLNWPWILRRRKFVQSLRRINDRELTQWFTGRIMYQEIDTWLLRGVANPIFSTYWRVVRRLIRW